VGTAFDLTVFDSHATTAQTWHKMTAFSFRAAWTFTAVAEKAPHAVSNRDLDFCFRVRVLSNAQPHPVNVVRREWKHCFVKVHDPLGIDQAGRLFPFSIGYKITTAQLSFLNCNGQFQFIERHEITSRF
jgi:hypothetical protein